MHVLVCQGNGKYYVSAAYGYFRDVTATESLEKNRQMFRNPFFVVWNEEKTRLIRLKKYNPNVNHIVPQALVIDNDRQNWLADEEGAGCVDFLSRELLDSFLDDEKQPKELLSKCRALDADYVYNETPEIQSQTDIDHLMQAAGRFHDAFLEEKELQADGTLYLLYDGVWGCKIELWFWGDLEYSFAVREESDFPYLFCCSLFLQNEFVYFFDDDHAIEEISRGVDYIKARHMKYRIIPN